MYFTSASLNNNTPDGHNGPTAGAPAVRYRNSILQHLSPESIARLKLRHLQLPLKQPLERSDQGISQIFFIESGIGSMTSTFRDGCEVEVGLFGNESMIGVSAFMGAKRSLNRVFMQMPGAGYASRIADAQAEFNLGGEFQRLTLSYVQMQLTQATLSAACNAKHDVGQRVATWLLLCADRAGTARLTLSQDTLAIMLGVRRTSISFAMVGLKRRGLVSYSRGHVQLLDIQALEAKACECYQVLKDHQNGCVAFDSGFAA